MTGLFDELDRQLQQEAQIPHAYYEILVHLSEAPGRRLRMWSSPAAHLVTQPAPAPCPCPGFKERGYGSAARPAPATGAARRGADPGLGYETVAAAAPGHVAADALPRRRLSPRYGALGRISSALARPGGKSARRPLPGRCLTHPGEVRDPRAALTTPGHARLGQSTHEPAQRARARPWRKLRRWCPPTAPNDDLPAKRA